MVLDFLNGGGDILMVVDLIGVEHRRWGETLSWSWTRWMEEETFLWSWICWGQSRRLGETISWSGTLWMDGETFLWSWIFLGLYVCMRLSRIIRTYIHTDMHRYIHAYIHIYITWLKRSAVAKFTAACGQSKIVPKSN